MKRDREINNLKLILTEYHFEDFDINLLNALTP